VGVALDPVDAHDRQHHMVADAGVVLGGQQLPGGGGDEECPRLLGAAGPGVGDIDHGMDAHQRVRQPMPGREITPTERASTTASWPACRSAATVWRPALPFHRPPRSSPPHLLLCASEVALLHLVDGRAC
jgi:hypothetical protein